MTLLDTDSVTSLQWKQSASEMLGPLYNVHYSICYKPIPGVLDRQHIHDFQTNELPQGKKDSEYHSKQSFMYF